MSTPISLDIDGLLQPRYTDYLNAVNDLAEFSSDLAAYPTAPTKPTHVSAESTWDTYRSDYRAWEVAKATLQHNIVVVTGEIPQKRAEVISILPANTWVRVADLSSAARYIAYRSVAPTVLIDQAFSPTPDALR